jgi:glyoxylase-like metal-dependent hydrolase (beta-lactamase superfamily II)
VSNLPQHEIYALRYATRGAMRSGHFIGGDPHDGPMPMDYFVWIVRSAERTVVVDTGFTAPIAAQRKRDYLTAPEQLLARFGVDPLVATDVVVTHLHYDHAGNLDKFPNAVFHIQDREVNFATGRYMGFGRFRHAFEVNDVVLLVRLVYDGRVKFHDGDSELAPGITLHRIGGHSDGLQCVRVSTARGWVVLASDTTHFYENFESERPFPTVFHVGEMLAGFRRIRELAGSADRIIPGHDPLVLQRYPAAEKKFAGTIVRVDVAPTEGP